MSGVHDRRSFIAAMASLAGFAVVDGATADAATQAAPAQAPADQPSAPQKPKWDLSWLDELKGKTKQLFDYGSFDLAADFLALRFMGNYLDAHKEVSGLETPEVNTIAGVMFTAFP